MVIEDARAHTHTQADAQADGYTLTVEDVAAQVHKSAETVRRYIRTNKLPARRIEGKNANEYRVNPDDVHSIFAHTQSHTRLSAYTHERAPMGVSVDMLTALTSVEQSQRQLYDEIAGLRSSMERLAVALENNTHAHTQAHDPVTAPPSPLPNPPHRGNARSRVLRWLADQLA